LFTGGTTIAVPLDQPVRDGATVMVTEEKAGGTEAPSRAPFLIVRNKAKEYGTANRLEGVFEPGERVCLVEDVVTSGGAAVEALEALREAGLECRIAVCVVDREEGGVDALARRGARLVPLFRAGDLLAAQKTAAKPHG